MQFLSWPPRKNHFKPVLIKIDEYFYGYPYVYIIMPFKFSVYKYMLFCCNYCYKLLLFRVGITLWCKHFTCIYNHFWARFYLVTYLLVIVTTFTFYVYFFINQLVLVLKFLINNNGLTISYLSFVTWFVLFHSKYAFQ